MNVPDASIELPSEGSSIDHATAVSEEPVTVVLERLAAGSERDMVRGDCDVDVRADDSSRDRPHGAVHWAGCDDVKGPFRHGRSPRAVAVYVAAIARPRDARRPVP